MAAIALAACGSEGTTSDTGSSGPTAPANPSASASATPAGPIPAGPSAAATVVPTSCSGDPGAHVYHPDRLKLLTPCVTVSGTIDSVTPEPDGDFHVRLRLDAGQRCGGQACTNPGNQAGQGGDLLLEPVCIHTVTQADAVQACVGYRNPLLIPPAGTHVAATGPFVLDLDHGWNEIHPLEAIAPTAAPAAPAPAAPLPASLSVVITASGYGHIAATTAPGASCTAQAVLPSGRTSTAVGLRGTQTADGGGTVSWTYGTSSATKAGVGRHTVSCTLGAKSATATAPFTV